jgi:hypothetical protein
MENLITPIALILIYLVGAVLTAWSHHEPASGPGWRSNKAPALFLMRLPALTLVGLSWPIVLLFEAVIRR